MQTPYDILGIRPGATALEIAAAYRTRAQILHPDRFHDAPENVRREAARLMSELNDAYATLRRPASRTTPPTPSAPFGPRPNGPPREATPPPPRSRWANVPWDQAVRARERSAAAAAAARRAREEAAVQGQAVARPRTPRSPTAIHYGLGEALVTNRIPCRRCESIQWLPETWRTDLDDTIYHCSICDNVLLAHRAK
jgi:hypothetical protein